MKFRLMQLAKSSYLSTAILWLAVLTFNNWILAIFFNRSLLLKDGSVSELSVVSQPHAWLFRALDITSGILFFLLGTAMARKIKLASFGGRVIVFGILLLGVGSFFDALAPLRCAETLSSACVIPVRLSFHHIVMPDHAYSSMTIGLSYFLLPLGGLIYGIENRLRTLIYASLAVLALTLIFLGLMLGDYIVKNSFSVRTYGLTQEIQMLVVGLWIVTWWRYKTDPSRAAWQVSKIDG